MRNLGQRVNRNNVFEVYSSECRHAANTLLLKAMGAHFESSLTLSEARVLDGLQTWFNQIVFDKNGYPTYETINTVYVFTNLNSGVNLVFITRIPYAGCFGGNANALSPRLIAVDFE